MSDLEDIFDFGLTSDGDFDVDCIARDRNFRGRLFSDDQPRDEFGRWSSGFGGEVTKVLEKSPAQIDSRAIQEHFDEGGTVEDLVVFGANSAGDFVKNEERVRQRLYNVLDRYAEKHGEEALQREANGKDPEDEISDRLEAWAKSALDAHLAAKQYAPRRRD